MDFNKNAFRVPFTKEGLADRLNSTIRSSGIIICIIVLLLLSFIITTIAKRNYNRKPCLLSTYLTIAADDDVLYIGRYTVTILFREFIDISPRPLSKATKSSVIFQSAEKTVRFGVSILLMVKDDDAVPQLSEHGALACAASRFAININPQVLIFIFI